MFDSGVWLGHDAAVVTRGRRWPDGTSCGLASSSTANPHKGRLGAIVRAVEAYRLRSPPRSALVQGARMSALDSRSADRPGQPELFGPSRTTTPLFLTAIPHCANIPIDPRFGTQVRRRDAARWGEPAARHTTCSHPEWRNPRLPGNRMGGQGKRARHRGCPQPAMRATAAPASPRSSRSTVPRGALAGWPRAARDPFRRLSE
jgi:hypothetical protein